MLGYCLWCHFNDSDAFSDRDDVRRCKDCGQLTAKWKESLVGLKVRKRRNADISVTYDGVVVVSHRFKQVCEQNKLTGAVFLPLPSDPSFFRITSVKIVKFDPVPAKTEFENLCPTCGQYESVTRTKPLTLKKRSVVPDMGFARTDLEFASDDEKHPLLLCGVSAGKMLKEAGLRGLEFEAFGLEQQGPPVSQAKAKPVTGRPKRKAVSIERFLLHLADSAAGFRCHACGDDSESLDFLAQVSNHLGPPASEKELAKIGQLLGPNAGPFEELYQHHNGLILYQDCKSDAAGVKLYPVAQWLRQSNRMRREFHEMGWEDEDLPDWLNHGIAFGEIPHSGNFFVVDPTRSDGDAVYYADHDDLECDPVAATLTELLDELCAAPADFLLSYGCYTRYSDGKTDTQWIPKEYVRDIEGSPTLGCKRSRKR